MSVNPHKPPPGPKPKAPPAPPMPGKSTTPSKPVPPPSPPPEKRKRAAEALHEGIMGYYGTKPTPLPPRRPMGAPESKRATDRSRVTTPKPIDASGFARALSVGVTTDEATRALHQLALGGVPLPQKTRHELLVRYWASWYLDTAKGLPTTSSKRDLKKVPMEMQWEISQVLIDHIEEMFRQHHKNDGKD